MTTASRIAEETANSHTEQVCGVECGSVRPIDAVMRKLQQLYPTKTAANIAARAHVSVRSAEYWKARKDRSSQSRDMSAAAFISLLYDEDGFEILKAAMEALPQRQRPRWWARQVNTARMAAIERAQAEQDEEIKQLRLSLLK